MVLQEPFPKRVTCKARVSGPLAVIIIWAALTAVRGCDAPRPFLHLGNVGLRLVAMPSRGFFPEVGAARCNSRDAICSAAVDATLTTPDIVGGCGRGRIRDQQAHSCRGPADIR